LAVLSGSLELPDDTGLFDAPERLHVLTGSSTPEAARRALTDIGVAVEPLAGVRSAAEEATETLARSGAPMILTEGGPGLLGALLASQSLDELCLTLAPRLVGAGLALLDRPDLDPDRWTMARAWAAEDDLFLRYLRPA
jgi:riboflavin biosynthesis pyrimidine reductase